MGYRSLPLATKLYIIFLVVCAASVCFFSVSFPLLRQPDISLAIYFALAVATARMTVKIPFSSVHTSLNTAFVFVILMLYGLIPALIVETIGQFILTAFNVKRSTLFKIPFNIAGGMVSIFVAYGAFDALFVSGSQNSAAYVLPIVGMTLAYYLTNTLTVSVAICLTDKLNLLKFWIKNFLPTGIGYISCASIATLLLIMDLKSGPLGFVVTIPLVALLYFSQKVYLQKEESARHHIEELEDVLLSTVQSLALTIDAKDPFTHGHVHRVRHLAVGLARVLDIGDEERLKGLAFSALVHDIGKIAIPDATLKKPGKYTDQEFTVMKAHSILGSEIVKNLPINFPVAKIVRHHHEKWNGRGYPDGLAGQEIPFESRIITVADVFDAIRSDRPYRPKMERHKVMEIMRQEMGMTLDPNITAVFLDHVEELEQGMELVDSRILDIVKATNLSPDLFIDSKPGGEEKMAQREFKLFNGFSKMLSKDMDIPAALKIAASSVSEVIPYSALVIYLPDDTGMLLCPATVDGLDAEFLSSNDMRVGTGVSGWVYQCGMPVVVPPPDQEFTNVEKAVVPYLSCMSVPMSIEQKVHGVLTIYSTGREAFCNDDMVLLQKMIPMLSIMLATRLISKQDAKKEEKLAVEIVEEIKTGSGTVLKILRGEES
jgi:HD domain/GAF domain